MVPSMIGCVCLGPLIDLSFEGRRLAKSYQTAKSRRVGGSGLSK